MERQLRLRGESEVRAARAQGKAYADGPLVARVLPNGRDPVQNRFAVVAGKRVGNAVERNRAKRVVREALRWLNADLKQGHDIVVIVRGTSGELPGYEAALVCLQRIVKRARLINESSTVSRQRSETTRRHDEGPRQSDQQSAAVHRDNQRLTTDD